MRMLAAYLDARGSYRVEGERTDAKLDLCSLRLESHVNLNNEMIEQKLAGQVRLMAADCAATACSIPCKSSLTGRDLFGQTMDSCQCATMTLVAIWT